MSLNYHVRSNSFFILFLTFLLAILHIVNQTRYTYYIPYTKLENIDKIIKEQDKMFHEMTTLPMRDNTYNTYKSPVETIRDENENAYKIIIDLKHFNNNPKNIKFNINKNTVSVEGTNKTTQNHKDSLYSFSQRFVLPEKTDNNDIKKEILNDKYVITIPIED